MNYSESKKIKVGLTFLFLLLLSNSCIKEEKTVPEKIEVEAKDFSSKVKETYRDTKDEICKMTNGKLECVKRRIKSEMKDMSN